MSGSTSYPFNGAVAAEFLLQVALFRVVAEPRHEQRLECVASNLRIFARFVYTLASVTVRVE